MKYQNLQERKYKHYETSAKDDTNVDLVFEDLVRQMLDREKLDDRDDIPPIKIDEDQNQDVNGKWCAC